MAAGDLPPTAASGRPPDEAPRRPDPAPETPIPKGDEKAGDTTADAEQTSTSEAKASAKGPGADDVRHAADVQAKIKNLWARTVHFGTSVGDRDEAPRTLSRQDLDWLSPSQLARRLSTVVSEEDEVERIAAGLRQRRVLLLVGPPETGKATLAFFLLNQARLAGEPLDEVGITPSLDRDVRVDVRALATREEYRRRGLVFTDVLARDNASVRDLLERGDDVRFDALSRTLGANHTMVVLTSDEGALRSDVVRRLEAARLIARFRPLGLPRLRAGLKLHVDARLRESPRAITKDTGDAFLHEHGPALIERLTTMPRLCRFVDTYLIPILEQLVTFDGALKRFENLEEWFLSDLRGDEEAWCFGLALVLTSPHPGAERARWLPFEQLRRLLGESLSPRRRTRSNGTPPVFRGDDNLANLARAQIRRQPSLGADVVDFKDSSLAPALWELVLSAARGTLVTVLPALETALTAEGLLPGIAAAALGRIAQLDTRHLALPRMSAWIHSDAPDKRRDYFVLGCFLQGVLGSRDETYVKACFDHLDRWLQGDDAEAAAAAVISLREVGMLDLARAAGSLHAALKTRFADKVKDVDTLTRHLRSSLALSAASGVDVMDAEETTADLVTLLVFTEDDAQVLVAVRYCLVGLCFGRDPLQIIDALLGWMDSSPEWAGLIIAIVFLDRGGVADVVGRSPIPAPDELMDGEEGPPGRIDRFVIALASGRDGPSRVAAFLMRVDRTTSNLPGVLRHRIMERILEILTRWSRDAAAVARPRHAMAGLFGRLLGSADAGLRRDIADLLKHARQFTRGDTNLINLASDALTWRERPSSKGNA